MKTPGPDLFVACLHCSQPSAPHGEHHPEHKKMGGRGPKAPATAHERDPLCRNCHDAHHREEFRYAKKDGFYIGIEGGDFRSPVAFDNDSPDKRLWEVEKLADDWHQADEDAVRAYQEQCGGAFAVKERIGWMQDWWLEAAKQLSKDAALPMDWHLVYDRVRSWETFEVLLGGGPAWDAVLLLGEKGRRAVCAHADPRWALDAAVVARLGGSTVAQVVKLLKSGDSDTSEKETCVCGEGEGCGHEHKRKGE